MSEKICLESCDMFEFMSKHVGLDVLHPGGSDATRDMLNKLQLKSTDHVLDIACGKGLNAIHIAKSFGCRVVGVDLSESSIARAGQLARKYGVEDRVEFRVANALNLPFEDNSFDVTIAQAMLILVDDQVKVITEAQRVLKEKGQSAWLELSWKKPTTNEFMQSAVNNLCGFCIGNVKTFDDWEQLLTSCGCNNLSVNKYTMQLRGMSGMMRDEGLVNGLKVMYKYMTKAKIRARMAKMQSFFTKHTDMVGYGIYIGKKH